MLLDALRRELPEGTVSGAPTKKQRMKEGTPLKHYLLPIIEESVRRQLMQSLQMPQLSEGAGPMVEPPSISPLQNMLMSAPQSGGGSTSGLPQQGGGGPYASQYSRPNKTG